MEALDSVYMTLIQTACVFLAATTVYSRHKLLHGIENVIYFIVVELYQQFLITCSMSFLADDILEFYNSTGNLMAVLPKAFNIYILSYFLVSLFMFLGLYLGLYRRKSFFYVSYKSYEESREGFALGKLFDGKERHTSKKDKSFHGYGTQNIKATVEKNNGILKSETGEGLFTLSVMIPRG